MTAPGCRVQAFLAAGHVCTVMGTGEYPALAEQYGVPIVVTGFEPLDILEGIRRAVHQLEEGRARASRTPTPAPSAGEGNPRRDRDAGRRVRGHRPLLARHRDDPRQRLAAAPKYRAYDAEHRFAVAGIDTARVHRVPQRRGAPGPDQAARVRGLRHAVHPAQARSAPPWSPARAPARRTTSTGGSGRRPTGGRAGDGDLRWLSQRWRSTSRAGPARSRCATARRSSWGTAAAARCRPS